MSSKPSVTIVIPAFRPGFLADSIESVLGQDYGRLELVVVDDSGGDEVAPILERYAGLAPGRIRFVRQENLGQARALNRGFELANGELIAHHGDDDLLLPGAVTQLVGALAERPEAVVSYGAYELIDDAGRVQGSLSWRDWSLRDAVRLHLSPIGPGALFRRPVIDRIGGWDPGFRYRSDFDFWIRAGLLGPFVRIGEPVAQWRSHESGLSVERGAEMAREHVRLVEKLYARDDLPADLTAVHDEAFFSAYVQAALVCQPTPPPLGASRFVVADRCALSLGTDAARSGPPAPESAEVDRALGTQLRAALARKQGAVERLQGRIAELERREEVAGPGSRSGLRRAVRAIVPRRRREGE
jgi:glycosyltransferase involved in cell wall biosynthesis